MGMCYTAHLNYPMLSGLFKVCNSAPASRSCPCHFMTPFWIVLEQLSPMCVWIGSTNGYFFNNNNFRFSKVF
jgi:hypothetical protein